jgi:hypothetical protein
LKDRPEARRERFELVLGQILIFEDQDVVIAEPLLEAQHELGADRFRSIEAVNLGAEWGTIRTDLYISITLAHGHAPSRHSASWKTPSRIQDVLSRCQPLDVLAR